jgi:prevent-host-death family protein
MMPRAVSAADANRNFSQLLREVRQGRSYVVTAHGKPVAKIVPFTTNDRVVARAREALLERLNDQPVIDAGRWTRDELYDDEQ